MCLVQAAYKKQHVRDLPQAFDRICFNFPHVGLAIKDQVEPLRCIDHLSDVHCCMHRCNHKCMSAYLGGAV